MTDHRLPEPVERWLIALLLHQTPEQRVRTVRRFVLGIRAAGALLILIIVGQYIDPRLVGVVKWPQYLLYAGFIVVLARFLPQVWQNWNDDKFPVIFVVLVILLMLWMMWFTLTEYKGRTASLSGETTITLIQPASASRRY